jgi:hypothetical protein
VEAIVNSGDSGRAKKPRVVAEAGLLDHASGGHDWTVAAPLQVR